MAGALQPTISISASAITSAESVIGPVGTDEQTTNDGTRRLRTEWRWSGERPLVHSCTSQMRAGVRPKGRFAAYTCPHLAYRQDVRPHRLWSMLGPDTCPYTNKANIYTPLQNSGQGSVGSGGAWQSPTQAP